MTGRQLRVVVRAEDYEQAVAFYCDALGLPEEAAFAGDDGAQVMILDAGRATLEISNPTQVRMIDEVEVGHPVSPHIRIAFEVDHVDDDTDALVRSGATLVAPPTETPWRSRTSRLSGPADLQLTLFEELDQSEQRPEPLGRRVTPVPSLPATGGANRRDRPSRDPRPL